VSDVERDGRSSRINTAGTTLARGGYGRSDRTAPAPSRPMSSGRAEDYRTGIATCRSVSFQSTTTAIGATSGTWGSRKS
jgi:hypothetical protein